MDAVKHLALRLAHVTIQSFIALIKGLISLYGILFRFFSAGDIMESYSAMSHLALNVQRPETEWFNMGCWENATDLPTASRDLAKMLYEAAGLRPGANILDVGCGCGDSLLLLAKDYKPALLHGVTSLRSHAERARTRCAATLPPQENSTCDISIYCEDAVAFVEARASEGESAQKYDYIFALDCAYHFDTRARFIRAAHKLLSAGGTLAMVDLAAAHPYPADEVSSSWFTASEVLPPPLTNLPPPFARARLFFTTFVSNSHLDSCDVYNDTLQKAGFDTVRIRDISASMFSGFSQWLMQLGLGEEQTWRGGGFLQLMALRAFGRGVASWARGGTNGTVRSVLIVGRKAGV